MVKGQDYKIWGREDYDAADIERVESAFLEQVHLYLTGKIPDQALIIFCTDHILNHPATRFIDQEIYRVISEIAIFATELTSTIKRLEQMLKHKAISE